MITGLAGFSIGKQIDQVYGVGVSCRHESGALRGGIQGCPGIWEAQGLSGLCQGCGVDGQVEGQRCF